MSCMLLVPRFPSFRHSSPACTSKLLAGFKHAIKELLCLVVIIFGNVSHVSIVLALLHCCMSKQREVSASFTETSVRDCGCHSGLKEWLA